MKTIKNNRLLTTVKLISKPNAVIADVGCDHCYTSILAFEHHLASFCFNIDNKKLPLQSGIENLKKCGFLDKTKNICADGLKTDEVDKPIDYCIISGLGSKTILEIITTKNPNIKIDNFIICANNNPINIREYAVENKTYGITYESILKENDEFYFLLVLSLNIDNKQNILNEREVYIGKQNIENNSTVLKEYLKLRKEYITSILALNPNQKSLSHELEIINSLL
ncbi:MAG: tRNA (adenine(22)-N(1))-methyltransferase TrmK [Mycoplasmataceae bacterium]|jgi:tRNA (adenine22-N1)-methyltransferase|nr:tRNA (adenine(22)-N(1))-methyltransferase TrmK [Mycoplasmataceae bacterium]